MLSDLVCYVCSKKTQVSYRRYRSPLFLLHCTDVLYLMHFPPLFNLQECNCSSLKITLLSSYSGIACCIQCLGKDGCKTRKKYLRSWTFSFSTETASLLRAVSRPLRVVPSG